MSSKVLIAVRGLAENVQRVADALDGAFPSCLQWEAFAVCSGDRTITLEAVGHAQLQACRGRLPPRPSIDG